MVNELMKQRDMLNVPTGKPRWSWRSSTNRLLDGRQRSLNDRQASLARLLAPELLDNSVGHDLYAFFLKTP